MIDFYTWKTPNGQKIAIMLEETQLPYKVHLIDLTKQEQFTPAFLKINPNNKIPVIIDHDGYDHRKTTVFESGAILIYLAEKSHQFLPTDKRARMDAVQWLMFQISGVGPMFGQLYHFLHFAAKKNPYAIERYRNESKRLYRVMDDHLNKKSFFAGEYSIADMAIFPWIHIHERQHIDLQDYPHLKRWYKTVAARDAVKKVLNADS